LRQGDGKEPLPVLRRNLGWGYRTAGAAAVRLRFVPVFICNGAKAGKGNAALLQHGVRWPKSSEERGT